MSLSKEFELDYQRAYKAKLNDDIDFINDFCGRWEEKAELIHIPYFMRLFNYDALNCEQNEFVLIALESIMKKHPQESINKIMENIYILFEEDSKFCITTYLTNLLLFWHEENIPFLVNAMLKAEDEIRNIILNDVINAISRTKNNSVKSIAENFLSSYKEKNR